jgi:hypothetical protein
MGKNQFTGIISSLVLLAAVAFCIQPALAASDMVSIAYRGAGGYYIGDTIILDGFNKAGNITVLKLTGPGLPAEGVPIYDLNGAVGTGNPVEVKDNGSWHYVWYTSSIKGIDQMQTARYYITAFDYNDPTQATTTSVMMKKPEFYVVATPDTLETGDYLQLLGTAEQGTTDIKIQVSDADGKVLHTYETGASESGYFTYAFHVDMQPGDYYITVSSPSVKNTFRTTITVIPPQTANSSVTATPAAGTQSATTPEQNVPGTSSQTGTLSVTSTPSGAPVFLDSVSIGVTPITLGTVSPGTHLVEIKSPGYLAYSVKVTVQAGETATLSPTLVKNPVSLPLSPMTACAGLLIAGLLFVARSPGKKD